jgi:hypothetical protein
LGTNENNKGEIRNRDTTCDSTNLAEDHSDRITTLAYKIRWKGYQRVIIETTQYQDCNNNRILEKIGCEKVIQCSLT